MHTTHYSSFPLRKTLLALAIGAASQTAMAANAAAAKQPGEETLIVEANETSDFKSGGDLVVPAFLDGQIAHGGRLGMLGEQKAMDVPFNVIGYTSKLIQDQQAKTIADVVSNDAGVQAVQGYGNFAETYRIRGFKLDGDDMTMGGLAGVVPRQVMDTQMLERVEIFKGANSLLNGAASSGVGGMINLEPKRAEDLPTARVGVDYTSDSQVGGTLDLGRRFGDNNQFGARVNLVHREGEGAIDNDKRRTTLASLGLDYRGDRFRSSLDFGYQKKTFHGGTMGVNISGVDFVSALPSPEYSRNMRLIGHSDQGGRPDGVQLMVHRGFAYIGHMVSQGFSVVDVRDPTRPTTVNYIAAPPGTWNVHLQAHDDLLLVINARDLFADARFADEKVYYTRSVGDTVSDVQDRGWSAGLRIFDISTPAQPREISFLSLNGIGIHRIWYVGGRWAYVSALIDGFTDYIFLTIDLADPRKPEVAGRWWLPGMHQAGGETPDWPQGKRYALHHAIIAGDTAYGSWRDGGLTLLDVKDRTQPRLISHRNWSPPFGGGTHTALPLPDRDLLVVLDEAVLDNQEDGEKLIWLFDIREPTNPVSIATFPPPDEADYVAKGAHFGPHNLHENRPGSFVSSTLIFATYQNAGVRAYDISNPYRPLETGALVPAAPERMMDTRPGRPRVIQSCDVFVDAQGIIYSTDYNGGLSVIEYLG